MPEEVFSGTVTNIVVPMFGKENPEIPNLAKTQKNLSVEKLQSFLADMDIHPKLSKKLLAFALRNFSYLKLREIGELIAVPSYPAVGMMVKRLEQEAENNKLVHSLLAKVKHYCQNV